MAGRWWQRAFVWCGSLGLHGALLAGTTLLVIDFRRLPEERMFVVTSTNPPAPCFLQPELRRRDLSYQDGRAFREDPDPQPCLEPCDALHWSVPGNLSDSSLRCTSLAGGQPAPWDSRPLWRFRYESWQGQGSLIPLRFCRSSVPTEAALLPALRWLARHQNADGGWSANGFSRGCAGVPCFGSGRPDFDEAISSLALLAFMAAGYSSLSKDTFVDPAAPERTLRFGETVKRGLQWLLSRQDPDGCLGAQGPKFLYNHALGTLALCEAYGMTAAAPLKDPSQMAVNFLVAARNPGAGWRYGIRDGETDTSVTGWALMALKSAELAELDFPRSAVKEALTWIVGAVQGGPLPSILYRVPDLGPSAIPAGPVIFADHPCMTAVGISCAQLQRLPPTLPPALLATLTAEPPTWAPGRVDFHYWFFSTSALLGWTRFTGPAWKAWSAALKSALIDHQKTAVQGCENGSWDPTLDRWGSEGGRVYATALNALNLCHFIRRHGCIFSAVR